LNLGSGAADHWPTAITARPNGPGVASHQFAFRVVSSPQASPCLVPSYGPRCPCQVWDNLTLPARQRDIVDFTRHTRASFVHPIIQQSITPICTRRCYSSHLSWPINIEPRSLGLVRLFRAAFSVSGIGAPIFSCHFLHCF